MIKKNTRAIFADGDFQGDYDWQGGIPLSEGEIMTVKINAKSLEYKLIKKEITCDAEKEDQVVNIVYNFELI